MTEQEWLDCQNSRTMLEFVRPKVTKRKLRLFAAACFRRLARLLPDIRQQQAVEMLEETPVEINLQQSVVHGARVALPSSQDSFGGNFAGIDDPYFVGLMLYRELVSSSTAHHATVVPDGLFDRAKEQAEQSRLLRCICGPLTFHAIPVDPAWLTSTVVTLAQAIFDDRAFDRMPDLIDALEQAGSTNSHILDHCRESGPHVLGCWVVDLLIGKS